MFGYISVNGPELKVRELELYRAVYCGICAELKERYGRRGQILLSYDCTFLALLLQGVYEPEETRRRTRCLVHPGVKHLEIRSKYTAYAADMNVLLACAKAADDAADDGSVKGKAVTALLRKDYERLREQYPRQEAALRRSIRRLQRAEKAGSADIDRVTGCTGTFLGEMCAPEKDIWYRDLRECGFYLGKFVSLLDAYDDLESDLAKGRYNVLSALANELSERPASRDRAPKQSDSRKEKTGTAEGGKVSRNPVPERPEGLREETEAMLTDMAACACRAFERLPVVENVDILRNILYSGIWTRFAAAGQKNRKKHNPFGEAF